MRGLTIYMTLIALTASLHAVENAKKILENVDKNRIYGNISYEGEMRIHNRVTRVKSFQTWQRGEEDAATVFTNSEDFGTKFLKLKNQMWIYYPAIEDVVKISGHLLREGLMGSDFSYEDSMENQSLIEDYVATLKNPQKKEHEPYRLELIAKQKTTSYPKRLLWVTPKTYSIQKMEMYTLSGKRLKTLTMSKPIRIKNRIIPTRMRMVDELKKGTFTEITLHNIQIDKSISERRFSKQFLYD